MITALDKQQAPLRDGGLNILNPGRKSEVSTNVGDVQYITHNITTHQKKPGKGFKKLLHQVKEALSANDHNITAEDLNNFTALFSAVYDFMKFKFMGINRNSGERYFEHLRSVVENVLELQNPNIEKVLIAILHDSIEDIEEIDYDFIEKFCRSKNIDGNMIALPVQAISKGVWEDYLDESEKDNPDKYKKEAKERRNNDYFSHMLSFDTMKLHISQLAISRGLDLSDNEIVSITKNAIDVKLADRVHNLSTQWDPSNTKTVKRKIKETEDFFLNIAKETNPDAFEKLSTEIKKLKNLLLTSSSAAQKIAA